MRIYADNLCNGVQKEINGKWTIGKPLSYWSVSRFREAWDVFIGKALAIYFREDE